MTKNNSWKWRMGADNVLELKTPAPPPIPPYETIRAGARDIGGLHAWPLRRNYGLGIVAPLYARL